MWRNQNPRTLLVATQNGVAASESGLAAHYTRKCPATSGFTPRYTQEKSKYTSTQNFGQEWLLRHYSEHQKVETTRMRSEMHGYTERGMST